ERWSLTSATVPGVRAGQTRSGTVALEAPIIVAVVLKFD
ncbi:MAG: hypothetical protein JWN39_2346, partial [Ilumatobacteraceae bacterium]|nr:hypothetical protein [Ilumatobacteraceae bacterium]